MGLNYNMTKMNYYFINTLRCKKCCLIKGPNVYQRNEERNRNDITSKRFQQLLSNEHPEALFSKPSDCVSCRVKKRRGVE